MRNIRPVSVAAAAAFAAFALAACGSDDNTKSTAAKPAAPAKPTVLEVTTSDAGSKRFTMEAPTTIKGGLVEMRFKNDSKAPHEAQLVRVDGQHSAQELLKFVDSGDQAVKIPDWIHGEGGVATVAPGASGMATSNLPAGTYYVTDTETGEDDNAKAPSRLGALAKVTVTAGTDGTLPATTAKIKVVDDGKDRYKFETSGLTAGTTEITFENASKGNEALHHVLAVPITPGKTIADVKKALNARNPTGPPPLDFGNLANTTVLDAGRSLVTDFKLTKPGSYALLCFLNDRDDTKPHFKQGLLKQVDIS